MVIVVGAGAGLLHGQEKNDPNTAANPYRMEQISVQLPNGRKLGAPIGVEIDHSDGKTLWVFERCGGDTCVGSTLDPVMKLDGSGKVLQISAAAWSIGRTVFMSIEPAMCGSPTGAAKTAKVTPS